MDPQTPQPWTLTTVLIAGMTVLATVVGYVFKLYVGSNKDVKDKDAAMIKERASWDIERARISAAAEMSIAKVEAEFETKFRELIVRYDEIASRDREANRRHEDQVRKDFAEIMERVSAEAGKSAAGLVEILQKFHDRFVGPRGY